MKLPSLNGKQPVFTQPTTLQRSRRARFFTVPYVEQLEDRSLLATIFVDDDAPPAGDGGAWETAYQDLQVALSAASSGDEIWVAAGTYKPTAGDDRAISFNLKSGVSLYGGFTGTETERSQRDWLTNLTTLSADIGTVGSISDNSYHVVYALEVAGAMLDGFTVTGGNSADMDGSGSGIYIDASSLTLANLILSDNAAGYVGGGMASYDSSAMLTNVSISGNSAMWGGGGIYSYAGSLSLIDATISDNSVLNGAGGGIHNAYNSPTLTNVTVSGNSASNHGGGGIYNYESSPTLTNVTISGNSAAWGGGIYNSYSSPTLTNVTLTGNSAQSGGGIGNYYYSSPTLTNVEISNNRANGTGSNDGGGGIYNDDHSSPILTSVTLIGNFAGNYGGGIYNDHSSSPTLTNVTLSENSAYVGGGITNTNYSSPGLTNITLNDNTAQSGGGIYNYYYSSPMMTNVTLSGNSAVSYGGGIFNNYVSQPVLTNVTLSGNSASFGGGILNDNESLPSLTNSILWSNTANSGSQIFNFNSSSTVTYSIVQGGWAGAGNLDADPLFIDAASGDLHLNPVSPAIDAGTNASAPTTDLDGLARPQDGDGNGAAIADMGAYEYTPSLTWSLSQVNSMVSEGSSATYHISTGGKLASSRQLQPDPEKLTIATISHAGDGCPAGTVASNVSSDASGLTLLFDSFSEVVVSSTYSTSTCTIDVSLQSPVGEPTSPYSFVVDVRGFAQLDPGVASLIEVRYAIDSGTGLGPWMPLETNEIQGPIATDYRLSAVAWLKSTVQALRVEATLTVTGVTGLITIDSVDAELREGFALPANESASVELNLTDVETTAADHASLAAAVQAAVSAYNGVNPSGAPNTFGFDGTTLTYTGDGLTAPTLTFSVPATDDDMPEGNERFNLNLSNPTSATGATVQVGTAEVSTTITDEAVNWKMPVIGSAATVSVPENTATSVVVLDVNASDADLRTQTINYSLSGPDALDFTIDAGTGAIQFATSPDYEMPADANLNNVYLVTVTATDSGVPALSSSQDLTITVTPVNEPPTVSLINVVAVLPESTVTTPSVKIADIVVTDDATAGGGDVGGGDVGGGDVGGGDVGGGDVGGGDVGGGDAGGGDAGGDAPGLTLSLFGGDASLFEIVGSHLYLKAGVTLDFETKPALQVTVEVDDPTLGVTPDDSVSLVVQVTDVAEYDFGDAPISYSTTLTANGARHLVGTLFLGASVDTEDDGQPSANADGDGADEDGVVLPATLYARVGATISVTASAAGRLDAWIDFNRNGVFDTAERIANGLNMAAGANSFTIALPSAIVAGPTFARFRISSAGGLEPTDDAPMGEVEDYPVTLAVPAPGSIQVVDDPENPGQGLLLVQGTNYFYETISVQPTFGQPGRVTASISPGATVAGIDLASFGRIAIFGEGGMDSITIGAAISKPSVIFGDAGFDTINGGGGADTIYGGADYDSLYGNAGADTFVSEGGADYIHGGADSDTLVKHGSGTFALSNYLLSIGWEYVSISSIENATLIGGNGPDIFNVTGWSGGVTIQGGGGTNTLIDSADGDFVVQLDSLKRTVGSVVSTILFTEIDIVNLTGGFGNNSFDLSAWPNQAVLSGGYYGTDTVKVAGNVDYQLTDVLLQRPGLGMIRLSGFENAIITGGSSANTFNLSNWNQAATLNGAGDNDKLIAAGNVNFTLSDASLTRSTGGAIALTSIEQAELIGGSGNNTINAAGFTGRVKIDGAAGNDTITSGSGIALLLGSAGNDVINAGSGRSLMIGGLGLDRLTGGSNDDLLIDGQTVHDDSAAALDALLAEWASSNSYLDRVAHLTGTSGGVNGSTHLGGSNVIHDASVDVLFGGDGDDLFFAKLDGTAATGKDNLSDQQTGEAAR